jgi:hypothetical protein
MDLHLKPLLEAGLLERHGDVYRLVPGHPISGTLQRLLGELGASFG